MNINIKCSKELVQRFKAIMVNEGLNNYRETLEGLVQLYEDVRTEEMKPKEPKVPTKLKQNLRSPVRGMTRWK